MVGSDDSKPQQKYEVHHTVYSVANLVTLLRLLLVPFFFATLVSGGERSRLVAFGIYAIAASTDWLDGQIARRTNTVTQFGKTVDPLVDRLLLAAGVVGLYLVGDLPLWIPCLLVLRDVYLLTGAYVLERRSETIPVSVLGKATTAILLVGFSLLILRWPIVGGLGIVETGLLPGLGSASGPAGMLLIYCGILLSLATAVRYTTTAFRILADLGAEN